VALNARLLLFSLTVLMPGLAFSQISSSMTLAPLPIDLKKEIELSGIPESAWGVVVLPIPSQVLMKKGFSGYGLNADRPLNPASVMKLVTTRAALGILGPDFRHQTRIATTGRLDAGVLKGDLFFQGGGDPKLVVEDLTEIVKRLKAMGIIRIEGNLVWSEGSRRLRVETEPKIPERDITRRIQLVDGGCNRSQVSARMGSDSKLFISGAFGRRCSGVDFYVSVMDHARFAYTAFRAAFEAEGGVMTAKLQSGPTPEHARTLVDWESPRSLISLVADINKLSNNPMTRQLFLNLSASADRPATREASSERIKAYLASKGLVFPELVIDNGSGLSRQERISAESMARLLTEALLEPDGQAWVETLPARWTGLGRDPAPGGC